ncbi:hypothetical protein PAERUG_P49_London_7_VIM_2_01_13_05914 [Pseudomonas aeruginosa]|nr:hypothetical protein PAERUG_P49_London_7_VIM_2_01_13_05914 [Pseudomonas aeruginosa]
MPVEVVADHLGRVAAGVLQGLGEGVHRHVGAGVVVRAAVEPVHQLLAPAEFGMHALEERTAGQQAQVRPLADLAQLRLGEVAAEHRQADAGLRAGGVQLAQEGVGGLAHQVVQHERGRLAHERGNRLGEAGAAQVHVLLAEHPAAGQLQHLAGDPVALPAPHVVRADQVAARAEGGQRVAQQRHQRLVRAGAEVEHALAALEALVGAAIPEQPALLFQVGNDFLAAGRGDGAEQVPHALLHQRGGCLAVAAQLATRVAVGGGQLEVQLRVGIDLGQGIAGASQRMAGHPAVGAVGGEQQADGQCSTHFSVFPETKKARSTSRLVDRASLPGARGREWSQGLRGRARLAVDALAHEKRMPDRQQRPWAGGGATPSRPARTTTGRTIAVTRQPGAKCMQPLKPRRARRVRRAHRVSISASRNATSRCRATTNAVRRSSQALRCSHRSAVQPAETAIFQGTDAGQSLEGWPSPRSAAR